MKKVISLTFLFILTIGLFIGCSEDTADGNSSVNANVQPITVVENGTSGFIIIKPENPQMGEANAASAIFKGYKDSLGVNIRNRSDSDSRTDNNFEIIIGNTNRPESKTARDMLVKNSNGRSNNYIICALNGHIVINAMTEKALGDAVVKYLADYVKKSTLEGNLCFVYNDTAAYDTVTINGNSALYDYKIVRSHYCTSYLTQLELEKIEQSLLKKTGYSVPIVEDDYVGPTETEIIVGGCSREGANFIADHDKWEILVKGTKIYLNGGSDYAVSVAATEFLKELEKPNLTLTDGVLKQGSYTQTVAGYDSATYYKYVWGDEFEGKAVDESKWYVCRPGVMDSVAFDGKPVYRSSDESTYVKDGKLYQVAMFDGEAYYGGFLRTIDMMHYKYGYIEIKQLTPDGDGFWTSLWLNADDYTKNGNVGEGYMAPEIDITENFGEANYMQPTIHRWPTPEGWKCDIPEFNTHTEAYTDLDRRVYSIDGKKFSDDFHTFGCFWDSTGMKFTCDGKVYHEYKIDPDDPRDAEIFHDYVYVNLSFAVYLQNSPLTPNASAYEWENTNKYIIDYVRIFQNGSGSLKIF